MIMRRRSQGKSHHPLHAAQRNVSRAHVREVPLSSSLHFAATALPCLQEQQQRALEGKVARALDYWLEQNALMLLLALSRLTQSGMARALESGHDVH